MHATALTRHKWPASSIHPVDLRGTHWLGAQLSTANLNIFAVSIEQICPLNEIKDKQNDESCFMSAVIIAIPSVWSVRITHVSVLAPG